MNRRNLCFFLVGIAAGFPVFGEVKTEPFVLEPNRWTKLVDCPPDPLGRELEPGRGAYWCFDATHGRFLRYGGFTPTDCNALWAFSVKERRWENLLPVDYAWPPPTNRPGAGAWWSMCYDTKRNVVWLHGGEGVASRHHPELFCDIWQFDPRTDSFRPMKSRKWPQYGARIVYDSKNDLVLRAPAYDGEWAALHNRDTTWVYDPNKNEWEGRATPGSPKAVPGGVWVFHARAGKAVYLGLTDDGQNAPTWTYDAAANRWEKLEINPSPPARAYAGCCYDPVHNLVIVYGGVGKSGSGYGYAYRGGGVLLNDTWALDLEKKAWIKLAVGEPEIPELPGSSKGRFILQQAMDYDVKNNVVVISAPTFGVWALRYEPPGSKPLPSVEIGALPTWPQPVAISHPVFPMAPPNQKLLNLEPNKWVRLGGGPAVGGGEVPMTYDEATGFCLRYGGCNDGGTTFASGYGNDLTAYDPATERWIALRWTDPCAPPRPANGCTRFYAYDPVRKVTWFASGTAGNRLASSLPPGFSGEGIWAYDGARDRFDYLPVSGKGPAHGVVCCFDRTNNLFITVSSQAWACPNVCVFDPERKIWTRKAAETRARSYTYGTYVSSMKALVVIEVSKEGNKTLAYDAARDQWRDLAARGEGPEGEGRPTLAYDPEQDVVLCLHNGQTYVYEVTSNTWKRLDTNSPGKASECMVYDTRHKVFLATHNMGEHMWAFRFKGQ